MVARLATCLVIPAQGVERVEEVGGKQGKIQRLHKKYIEPGIMYRTVFYYICYLKT